MRRWALAVAVAAGALAFSASARADDEHDEAKPELPSWRDDEDDMTAIGVELYGSGMMAMMNGYGLATSGSAAPEPLADKHLNLRGNGWLAGGGLRLTLQAKFGLRGGLGLGAYTLGGMSLEHDELARGVTAEIEKRPIMLDTELFIGKAFDARYFYPYVDAKASFDYVSTSIALNIEGYGHVGATDYHVWSATVGPRVGAFIPVSSSVFVDVSGQYGLTGAQRGGFSVAIGIWDD